MSFYVKSPLSIPLTSKKQFILNLNNYRNLYFQLLNKSKVRYKEHLKPQIESELFYTLNKIAIIYEVHKGDKRRFDIGNVCSIHQKYFEDAMVELGKLPDDKNTNIPLTVFLNGYRDIDNPRVDIFIYDLNDKVHLKEFLSKIREGIKLNMKGD